MKSEDVPSGAACEAEDLDRQGRDVGRERPAEGVAIEIRSKSIPSSDVLLILLYVIYEVFLERFEKRVFVDSLSNLAHIYLTAKDSGLLHVNNGVPVEMYHIGETTEGSRTVLSIDPNLLFDLELLETFGLVYRLSQVTKFGANFTQKFQTRISGWGRGFYEKNLRNKNGTLAPRYSQKIRRRRCELPKRRLRPLFRTSCKGTTRSKTRT